VFAMQHGPGAENAFGGVAQAYSESVPLLVLPGKLATETTANDDFNVVSDRILTTWPKLCHKNFITLYTARGNAPA
jgi:thiamine pyrophosphate-dependent acetolactate synthase large subunit-like protein